MSQAKNQLTKALRRRLERSIWCAQQSNSHFCELKYAAVYLASAHLLDDFGVPGRAVRQRYSGAIRKGKRDVDLGADHALKELLFQRLMDHLKKNRRAGRKVFLTSRSGDRGVDALARTRFGYTMGELIEHLESRFSVGMSRGRLVSGDIQTDHVLPTRIFDLSSPEGVRAAYALSNLQPLWRGDNARKGRTIDREWIAIFGEGTIRA